MNEKLINGWLDIAPAYLNFAIKFLRQTRTAFADHAKPRIVSSDLTSILVGGVALSYMLALVVAPAQMKQDPSLLVQGLLHLEYYVLPVVGLLAAMILGIAAHGCGKLYAVFSRACGSNDESSWSPRLGGTLEDSVNASLGFAAVFLPVATAALCLLVRAQAPRWIIGIVSFLLAIFILVYFPLSMACTHPSTRYRQAFIAMFGTVLLPILLWWVAQFVLWIIGAV